MRAHAVRPGMPTEAAAIVAAADLSTAVQSVNGGVVVAPAPATGPGRDATAHLTSAAGARPVAVSVVVVTWNGAALLDECLGALRAQTMADRIEVVVVENGSADDSMAQIARHGARLVIAGTDADVGDDAADKRVAIGESPWLRVVVNDRNRGFATGCNQGIRVAHAPLVALLNNDAVPEPAWLAELVGALDRLPARTGAVTSKVVSYADRGAIDNVGHVVFADGLTRGRGRLARDRGQYSRIEEVFCASGCASLFRRAMLDDVALAEDGGPFDDAFFAYCDDADLGFRARLRGWRCFYVPTAVVAHRFSQSSGAFSPLKALNVERNRLWLAVRNLPLPLLLLSPLFTLARYGWQGYGAFSGRGASGRFAQESSRGALASILARAYWQALLGMPRALRQRRAIQRRRIASTRDVVRWLHRYGIGPRAIALLE